MVSKKKRSSPILRLIFGQSQKFIRFLPPILGDLQKKLENRTFERGLFSDGGGYFQFFTKNLPQKHQKRAILHTSQANGGAVAPPPPPLATLLHMIKFVPLVNQII